MPRNPMPQAVRDAVLEFMERPDFAYLERDPASRKWWLGVYNGRLSDTGELRKSHVDGDRLTAALELARGIPVTETLPRIPAKPEPTRGAA